MEVFDHNSIMSVLFGTGDGRAVLRGSADPAGVQSYTVPDQGGTRIIVAVSHSVRNLLQHDDAYVAGCMLAAAWLRIKKKVSAACRHTGEGWPQVDIPELCDLCIILNRCTRPSPCAAMFID